MWMETATDGPVGLMRLGGNTFAIIFYFQANKREMRTKAVLQTMDFLSYPNHE